MGIRAFLANLFGNVLAFMPYGFFYAHIETEAQKNEPDVSGGFFTESYN